MKRNIWSGLLLLVTVLASAQTQQGYVKTKGRLGNNGSVIAGTRLSGATVTVKGGNAVLSGNNGTFSLSIPNNNYFLQNVQKQGYVLTDPDVLSKQYAYSKNPLVLVLEDKDQQQADRRAIERKISSNLYAQLQKRNDELEALKEQHKITEEKYRELLQKLNSDQDDNTRLISEMADRYSKMDFDDVDEFNRRISDCILNGRLTEADSLINTKGDINSRTSLLRQHQEANAQAEQELRKKQKKLEKSKLLAQKELEDLAQDCYSKFEIFKMQHENDSAAYYIEYRASLDTLNAKWQDEAGGFLQKYIADYEKAGKYLKRSLLLNQLQFGENSEETAQAYNHLGTNHIEFAQYDKAMNYLEKACAIQLQLTGGSNLRLASYYESLGTLYYHKGEYNNSLAYFEKTRIIKSEILGENSLELSTTFENMGVLNNSLGNYEDALAFLFKALEIRQNQSGDNSLEISLIYNNIALVYKNMKETTKAIEYYEKAINLGEKILGQNHPDIGMRYNNIGSIYDDRGELNRAMEYYRKALVIVTKVLGDCHPRVATIFNNIGSVYYKEKDYKQSLEYVLKAVDIEERVYGKDHPDVAISYANISAIYKEAEDYTNALSFARKALEIFKSKLGDKHVYVEIMKEKVKDIESSLNK